MTREQFKDRLEQGNVCIYDMNDINEFDLESDTLYMENGDEYKFDDINFDYFYEFEIISEEPFSDDIREIIKELNKCIKDYNKFTRGESCIVALRNDGLIVLNDEELEMMYSIEYFNEIFERDSVVISKLKRIKNK